MAPKTYRRVAVIGAGPSGLSALKALSDENIFETIKLFERRDRVGGTWLYDPIPDVFPSPVAKTTKAKQPPPRLPSLTTPAEQDTQYRTGTYDALDSNVGAIPMAFTHTPFPEVNSAISTLRYGSKNPTRPYKIVAGYLEEGFKDYIHLLSLNTAVESVQKVGSEWVVTLRKSNQEYQGHTHDFWWQERFDAIVVATGHYTIPYVPSIWGIDEAYKALPTKFEHSKSFRSADHYVGKKVVVVGGSVSAVDLVAELAPLVQGPIYLSQRGRNPLFEEGFNVDGVVTKPSIRQINPHNGGVIEFEDGSTVENFDRVIFATGYRLSYPFLTPDPVTPQNRLAGYYQHIFNFEDPSLAIVGQVKAALSFRVYEYQAVAVARFLAGRSGQLPSVDDQRDWETKRLKYKGPTNAFHAINPDFDEYFTWLKDFAGKPAQGTKGYELPAWDDKWPEQGLFAVVNLKNKYWKSLQRPSDGPLKAKL